MTMLKKAIQFATKAHGDQVRKYTGKPYIHHPLAVMEILRDLSFDEEVLCAAVLHDTVEDTATTLEDIEKAFNHRVASLVEMVTDVSRPEDGNREVRKEIDRLHLSNASRAGKSIKLADMINNAIDITKHDPNFSVTYMREMRDLLPMLEGGDLILYRRARRIINEYFK